MTQTRRVWRAVAAAVAALVPSVVLAPSATAGPTPSIALVAQDAWTLTGGDVHAKLDVQGAAPGASIWFIAHQSLQSRDAFDSTLEAEGDLGGTNDTVVVPVDALPLDANGNRDLTLRLEVPGGVRLAETLGARGPGVYPLEVELRDADNETQAGFITYLVVVGGAGADAAITSPLGVAWIWPLSAPPATLPSNGLDPEVVNQLEPDGRLGRQVSALDRTAGVPLTIVPGPETLDAWVDSSGKQSIANGVLALQRARAVHQVVASAYMPIDLPSLLRAGMAGTVDAHLAAGEESLRVFFGERVDPRTALARPVDGAALSRLRTGGVDRLIVETDALAADEPVEVPDRPFLLEPPPSLVAAGPITAVASDSALARLLSGDDPPAVRAQRLLAGLSVMAYAETAGDPRAVTIANPAQMDPPEELIDAVLDGLRANPLLTPTTVDAVFEQLPVDVNDESVVTRELATYEPPAPPVPALAYESTRARLASLRGFAPGVNGIDVAERALLSSVSSAWSSPDGAARAEAELASVEALIGGFLARIEVPEPSTITLTDRAGDIPLTFRNDTEQTVTVLIQLQSPKLSFPDGIEQVVELQPQNTTVHIAVESRTSGSFPLSVTVTSFDGALTIAQAQIQVQATEVSAVGLVLLISAAVFLALWWMWHTHRERARKRVPAPVPEPAT